jgi:hypothetical protein
LSHQDDAGVEVEANERLFSFWFIRWRCGRGSDCRCVGDRAYASVRGYAGSHLAIYGRFLLYWHVYGRHYVGVTVYGRRHSIHRFIYQRLSGHIRVIHKLSFLI